MKAFKFLFVLCLLTLQQWQNHSVIELDNYVFPGTSCQIRIDVASSVILVLLSLRLQRCNVFFFFFISQRFVNENLEPTVDGQVVKKEKRKKKERYVFLDFEK